ncbi:MAG: SLC13 family permease, partial [Terrimicrobiaceae bacterium]
MFSVFPIPEIWRTIIASLVGLLTLGGIMTRPFGWNEAVVALGGAAVLLLLGLIADTASFLLPISNPINIIILSRFPLDLFTFLRLLLLPSLIVIAINIAVFFLLYRNQLKGSFDIGLLPAAASAVKHKAYFSYTCAVLALVAVGYVAASAVQLPLSLVAMTGSAALLVGALSWRQITLRELGKSISWSIFGFIAGMFILVQAIEDTGLTAIFGRWLMHLSGGTTFGAVMVG